MSSAGYLFTLVACGMLFALPRRWALLPFLSAAAYVPFSQVIEIGPLHFPVVRILIALGFARVLFKGERIAGKLNALDWMMILWALWLVFISFFHESGVLITQLGEVFTDLGLYILFRVFVQEIHDIRNIFKAVCILLLPLAALMVLEKLMAKNYFSLLFDCTREAYLRNGHVRALGPFAHAITAGTVGAVCLPMALCLWRQERKLALLGLAAIVGIVFASGSSGPMMTALSVMGAMALWKFRGHLRAIRWLAVIVLLGLNFVMNDPVYFLIARIDLAGGSTSYFRAQLIKSGIEHVNEWWLVGTDHTRHWMDTGTGWNPNHTDITNHYLAMGVWGGLALLVLFIAIIYAAFSRVGNALHKSEKAPIEEQFLIWTLGSILFGHAATFFSVSYFDQTVVFLYWLLASIGSLEVAQVDPQPASAEEAAWPFPGSRPEHYAES